jgi:hypothetical protein
MWCSKKLHKVNNRTLGENSPNLVALVVAWFEWNGNCWLDCSLEKKGKKKLLCLSLNLKACRRYCRSTFQEILSERKSKASLQNVAKIFTKRGGGRRLHTVALNGPTRINYATKLTWQRRFYVTVNFNKITNDIFSKLSVIFARHAQSQDFFPGKIVILEPIKKVFSASKIYIFLSKWGICKYVMLYLNTYVIYQNAIRVVFQHSDIL